jgi:uncharacterized protein YecE (DUF72 family)
MPRAFIGISGYDYAGWRGSFYPPDVPRHAWLAFASRIYNSVELNGTFYSLKSPAAFQRWADAVPDNGFVFAIKGGRFITHNLKLRNCESALGNFFASGVLALGDKTGPFLWQLPASYRFDAERMDSFMSQLPRHSVEGEAVARQHDHRLRHGVLTKSAARVRYRHAFEVRHPSYFHDEFYDILRAHGCAFVIADTAGTFGYAEEVTADFVYVRLHGSGALYRSDYTDDELAWWAEQSRGWLALRRDVYVYFDNDAHTHAPYNAMQLQDLLASSPLLSA